MNAKEYVQNALRTEPKKYLFGPTGDVTPRIEHAVMGIVTEAGELMDRVKRTKIYGEELDRVNLVEEAGGVFWYLAVLCDAIGVSFEEVWERNIAKLRARFPEKYSHENALNRDLKQERAILEETP